MKYSATLRTESNDAKSISSALDVDNITLDNLDIESGHEGNVIVTRLESDNLRTIISTLDDLISCQMAAEKLIKKTK